jgi:FMN phosphatase YigB (HAD superfamily)
MGIRAVCFDVGETIVDETRIRRIWADWLGVSVAELEEALTDAIRRRKHHRTVFERLRPGFDLDRTRRAGGDDDMPRIGDLYPDVLPCFRELKRRGWMVGIAGNQTRQSEREWAQLPVDLIGSSGRWSAEKPAAEFFSRLISEFGCAPGEIAYVGDRVDNDVLPARAAGMLAVFVQRGPWADVQARWPEAALAHLQLRTLEHLPSALALL